MIKIAAPVHAPEDCEALIAAGAAELYCGVMAGEGDGLNFRNTKKANLPDFAALKRLVRAASGRGAQVYFCLNAFHAGEKFERQKEQAEKALGCGVTGLIVADFPLIPEIKKLSASARIVISTAASCSNPGAAGFYAGLGADRVVLERHLTIGEISVIAAVAAARGLETEALVRNITCTNINGFCELHHLLPTLEEKGRRLPPCRQAHELLFSGALPGKAGMVSVRGVKPAQDGPLYCGVCALQPLLKSGVTAVKIVGRDFPADRVLKDVKFVSRYISEIPEGRAGGEDHVARGAALHEEIYGRACLPDQCFYYETRREFYRLKAAEGTPGRPRGAGI